ncbi:MAG TPA: hypothetical protein VNC16_06845 [Solirubrobacterales bacterium]|jgi:hypothetical protein|nr:hypothetical protein [Solirubrobacterales bacterium]
MRNKLKILAAGTLCALALAAFPAVASAGEFPVHCLTETCSSTITVVGNSELKFASGSFFTCASSTGTMSQPNNSSTGTAQFTFHNCKDTIWGFHCSGSGPTGTVSTNTVTYHDVYLDPLPTRTPGILFTGVSMTFTCGLFGTKTVTGDLIGHWENSNCGETRGSNSITFEAVKAGYQRFTQVTTTGAIHDLAANNDAGGAPETFSVITTQTITHANKVALTC